jgi:hypothetical protein
MPALDAKVGFRGDHCQFEHWPHALPILTSAKSQRRDSSEHGGNAECPLNVKLSTHAQTFHGECSNSLEPVTKLRPRRG